MTHEEFSKIVDRLGVNRAQLAVLLGVSRRAVGYYETGDMAVPRQTALLLRALDEGALSWSWVNDRLAACPSPKVYRPRKFKQAAMSAA